MGIRYNNTNAASLDYELHHGKSVGRLFLCHQLLYLISCNDIVNGMIFGKRPLVMK